MSNNGNFEDSVKLFFYEDVSTQSALSIRKGSAETIRNWNTGAFKNVLQNTVDIEESESIEGITGMLGEAWGAFTTDTLKGKEANEIRVLAEWSEVQDFVRA